MIKAQEAYSTARQMLDELDISRELTAIESKIRMASANGYLATASDPMDLHKAERLSLELEEFGFNAFTMGTNQMIDGKVQTYVQLNWKHMPSNTRDRFTT